MKNYTIFYSWQSDYGCSEVHLAGKRTNNNQDETEYNNLSQKDLIQNVLERQAYWLGKKHKCNITVDIDTDDTTGMQPISDIVIKRIRNCHIFVCDVTPVTSIRRGTDDRRKKSLPNSNVMFELGIAISYLEPYQIIAIAHEGDWIVSELPFDISHRKIIMFKNKNDIDSIITPELEKSLTTCQSLRTRWKTALRNVFTDLSKIKKESETKKEQAVLYNSEVFFQNRMAISFPGVRGLMSVQKDMLNKFFIRPISHLDASPIKLIDEFNEYPIKQFKNLKKDRILLIGNTEVKVNDLNDDILVYRNQWNSKFEFILIKSHCASPVYYDGSILFNQPINNRKSSEVEEYAIYYGNKEVHNITKELYDDGLIYKDGKYISLTGKSESRRRYLKDCLIMIVPSDNIFNKTVYNRVREIFDRVCYQEKDCVIDTFERELNAYFQTLLSSEEISDPGQIINESANNNVKEQRVTIENMSKSEIE